MIACDFPHWLPCFGKIGENVPKHFAQEITRFVVNGGSGVVSGQFIHDLVSEYLPFNEFAPGPVYVNV